MPAVRKRKTYTKRKSSRKSRTNRRLGRWKVRRWLRNKKPYKVAKLINVANNHEVEKKVVKVQKVSKKQGNIIRKRFREGYSPFIDRVSSYLQLITGAYNKSNWASFVGLTVNEIHNYFDNFPYSTNSPSASGVSGNAYKVSETQSIYVGSVVETLEIVNPSNYDVNLVIYDFVYKDNVINETVENEYEYRLSDGVYRTKYSNHGPLGLINGGLFSVNSSSHFDVASPTDFNGLTDINTKPTDSYAFNIYCRIVKKTVYRLQPGASLKHIFVYKPRGLINRGYFGYKYLNSRINNRDGIMKDVTYGMICKTWGQIANSGSEGGGDMGEVVNLSGNITFKRTKEVKWYAMDSKYTYIRNSDTPWTPGTGERPEVVNDESIRVAATMNLDPTDNNNEATTSGS